MWRFWDTPIDTLQYISLTSPVEPILFKLFPIITLKDLEDRDYVASCSRTGSLGSSFKWWTSNRRHFVEQVEGVSCSVACLLGIKLFQGNGTAVVEELSGVCLVLVDQVVGYERKFRCKIMINFSQQ